MSEYYSSQATLEAKVIPLRVKLWGDKDRDGTVDSETLEQALAFAKNHILSVVYQRYGSQADDWDFDTAPPIIKTLSDDLAIFYLATGTQTLNPVIQQNFENAMSTLKAINLYEMTIPGVSDEDDYQIITETYDSDLTEDCTCDCHNNATMSPCCNCHCSCCH